MNILLPQYLAIFIASSASLTLVFFKVSIVHLQQTIAFLLVVLLIFISRFSLKLKTSQAFKKLFLISVSITLTQLVVIAAGGLLSPLLILIHLYTLGSSFLLNLTSSILFLVFSLAVLGLQIYLSHEFQLLIINDPATPILYILSFIIIIPLSQFLMDTYNIKDKLSRILGENILIGKGRESFILSGLNELVVVTNQQLQITSVSESVAKLLKRAQEEIINKPVFETLPLKDTNGRRISTEDLPIRELNLDKATRIIKGFNLQILDQQLIPIIIQLKPITDSQMKVSQLVFIISDARLYGDSESTHFDLEQTLVKHKELIANIKKLISGNASPQVKKTISALDHTEEDLHIALEIEDHPVKEKISFDDIAYLSQQALESRKPFARDFNVSLHFIIPKTETSEQAWLKLKGENINQKALGKSEFMVPIDQRWFKLLVQELLNLGILLSSDNQPARVDLSINRSANDLWIAIIIYCKGVESLQKDDLFIKHFGRLASIAGFTLSSGLEGFIAKSIATALNIPLSVQIQENPHRVNLSLKINKTQIPA